MSVVVNSPKSPVTKGSNGIATATVPNVCKMPGPPAPFVPTPLPNIGRSSLSPKGYSKKVKIEGKPVAIKGATFASQGDIASKGTGGGIVSSNTHGPTKFVGPGALDTKIEGKSIQLLSDPMLNNCGPSGNPPNSATLVGVIQPPGIVVAVPARECPVCGETHEELKETEESQVSADGLAAALKAELAKDLAKRGEGGFYQGMIGVAMCKTDGGKYADQSGKAKKTFRDAAKSQGMKCSETGKESATNVMKKLVEFEGEAGPRFRAAGQRVKYYEANKAKNPAAYPVGSCAGQGAATLLFNDGGIAVAMTERWFSSSGHPMTSVIKHWVKDGRKMRLMDKPPQEWPVGSTVPPCETCNIILPVLLCTGGKTECDHK